ncbi:MAG: PEGA domain-containing protein [Planctomycetota bacterium]
MFRFTHPVVTGFVVAVMLIGVSGCASIVTPGNERPVRVETLPEGADVFVNDDFRGKTPLTVSIPRKDTHRLRIEASGYEPFNTEIKPGFNGWVLGNILLGGLIGLVVDIVSGATSTPSPGGVFVDMLPVGSTYPRDAFKSGKDAIKKYKAEQKKLEKERAASAN